jgi:hypothetical protein
MPLCGSGTESLRKTKNIFEINYLNVLENAIKIWI